MFTYSDERTIAYPEANIYWKDYLKLNSGSLLMFYNMFGPNRHSNSIEQERNFEIKIHVFGKKNYHNFK